MVATAFGHQLETLHDGLTVLSDGRLAPVPLLATVIAVEIRRGLAVVRTTRTFRNDEDQPIEAILTMPVGFDGVMTGLSARIDGRSLVASAASRESARESYETALDQGKMAILHEEVLRGVHMLSVGQLAPGKEVAVTLEATSPLSQGAAGPFLRLPVTVGQLYGVSPLAPVDDLTTSAHVRHVAQLTVQVDQGHARLGVAGLLDAERPVEVTLNAAIEIVVPNVRFGSLEGRDARGRQVRLDLRPAPMGDWPLDLAILVDRSRSTGSAASAQSSQTIWEAMRNGLTQGVGATWPTRPDCTLAVRHKLRGPGQGDRRNGFAPFAEA